MPLSAQRQDELFDVVDENDNIIGQETRGEVHRLGLKHRAVHIFIYNTDGDVLLQKRSPLKDVSPGKWTTACSGHVDAGETYDTAAVRELREELGIAIESIAALKYLSKYPPCEETGMEFVAAYAWVYSGAIEANPQEISATAWYSPKVLDREIIAHPERFARSFQWLWKQVRGANA